MDEGIQTMASRVDSGNEYAVHPSIARDRNVVAGMKKTGCLIDTGSFAKKDRITHCIALSSPDQIDDEVIRGLKTAYDRDGS